jgi:hypothetical protein
MWPTGIKAVLQDAITIFTDKINDNEFPYLL